jgi:predicted AlkP superfamily pyrophosphatase or phosphodiesterase
MTKKTIILSIDALQTEDLKVLADEPVFSGFLKKAAVVENVREVYPTLTNVNHVSIITGVTPDRHGVFHNMTPFVPPRDVRWNLIGQNWFWHKDSIKVPTLVDAAKEKGYVTACVSWPSMGGQTPDYNLAEVWSQTKGTLRETYEAACTQNVLDLYYDRYIGSFDFGRSIDIDSFIVPVAADIIRQFKPDLLLAHVICLDYCRHKSGNNSPLVKNVLKRVDAMVGTLLDACRKAGTYEDTNVFLLGDHGQMDVRESFNMNVALREHGLVTTDGNGNVLDYEAYSFSAGFSAQIILKDPTDPVLEERVYHVLTDIMQEYPYYMERIYTREEALMEESLTGAFSFVVEGAEGICFENAFDGPLILSSLDPDYRSYRSNHGYHPLKGPKPPLIAFGPDIREGAVIRGASILEECPTFAKAMGLEMSGLMCQPLEIFK